MKTKKLVKQNKKLNKKTNKKTNKKMSKRRQTRKNNLKRIKRKNRRTRRRGGMKWPFGSKETQKSYVKLEDSEPPQSPSTTPMNKPPVVENPEDVKRKQLVQMNRDLNDYKRQTGELVNSTEDILRKQFNNVSGMSAENRLKHHRMKFYKNNNINILEEKRKAKAEEMKVLQGKTWGKRSQEARQLATNKHRLETGKEF